MTFAPSMDIYVPDAVVSDAETSLLGLILRDAALPPDVQRALQPHDFQHEQHQIIYRVMLEMTAQSIPLDPVSVEAEVRKQNAVPAYANLFGTLILMMDAPNPAIDRTEYVRRILRGSQARHALGRLPELETALKHGDIETAQTVLTDLRLTTAPVPFAHSDRPRLSDAALHGLAGDFVRLIEPHTESDPAAILAQFLCAFGNIIGRTAHAPVEASKHYMNLFVLIVGQSAKARKGTSWGHVRRLLEFRERDYADKRIGSGLVSAEGLIYHVRDTEDTDRDKRILIVESEFASVLSMSEREGNTLSACLRDAWDKGDLSTLSKNNPVRATDAHISIIGHITQEELRRKLSETESANGFANRFLWVYARRTKSLPEGGHVPDAAYQRIAERVGHAVSFAWDAGEMRRDDAARTIWAALYDRLTRDVPGLLGAVTSRAESQVLRLSCLYALLDCSPVVTPLHLRAAAAFWEYCEDSARFIFGDALGDRVADTLLMRLRGAPDGMTRTEISKLFARNVEAARIQEALEKLREIGKAVCIREKEGTGRPSETWKAVTSR